MLLAALFVLMLFPRASAPAVASQRASGEIVAREVVQHDPARTAGGLTVRTESGTELGLKDAGATGGGTLLFTSDPVDAGQAFDHLGVHWIAALGSEDTFYVEVRTSRDGASWSEWAVFTADEDMADHDRNEWFAGPYAVPAARFAQYRIWLTGGDAGALEQVALSFMDVSDLNAGPIARLVNDLHGALSDFGRSYAEAAPAGASAIRSRQDWAADENLMLWAPKYQPVQKAIIHHTVTDDGGTNPAASIRSIYYYHAVTRGWGDIGYNYIVDKFGNIWTGRQGGDGVIGGHAYGWNNGTIGVAALGDYSVNAPTGQLQGALENIIALKFKQLGLQPYGNDVFTHQEQGPNGQWVNVTSSPPNIQGHRNANYILSREGGQTACPGNGIYNMLDGIRRLAQAAVDNGYTTLPYVEPQLGKAGVPGTPIPVSVSVTNRGVTSIPAGTAVSYKLLSKGAVSVSQGAAAQLQSAIAPGASASVNVPLTIPVMGTYIVRWDLQSNGMWWNDLYRTPYRDVAFRAADWGADWVTDNVPLSWTAGEIRTITVTVLNDGGRTWNATGAGPVKLGYKWVSDATGNTFPGPSLVPLPADVAPGQQVRLPIVVTAPQYPTNYTLYLDLYKENEFAFADKGIAPDDTPTGVSVDFKAGYQWSAPALTAGQTATVPVTITNLGRGIFPVTNSFPVNLGYHWLSASGQTVVWDGARTKLGADLGPQQSVSVNAQVTAPPTGGNYQLRFDLVQEGVAWFSTKGVTPGNAMVTVAGPVLPAFGAAYAPGAPSLPVAGTPASVPITLTNTSNFTWSAAGMNPVTLSYHWADTGGRTVVWDGARTKLLADVPPQGTAQLAANIVFPSKAGTYLLRWDLVQEGVSWFSGKGVATLDQTVSVTPNVPLFYGGSIDASGTPAAMGTGMTVSVPLKVQNLSNFDFDSSINLSYHWYDASGASVVWDGVRTSLAGLRQGEVRAVSVQVAVPATVGGYTLRYDVVREGVAWFSSKGMQLPSRSVAVQLPPYGATYAVQSAVTGQAGTSVTVPVTLTNNGSLAWQGGLFNLAYHLYSPSGAVVVWDGARSPLPGLVSPGQSIVVNAMVAVPATAGTYTVRFDLVQEGTTWFSSQGVAQGTVTLAAQ
ncbi:MAG: hypothetical protein E6H94_04390 [Chloroflexi bacterium]|nr:MAG: hypothetical protein E6H94_04390 [Chloroflexota bacterium]